jgi:hypothetical protein
VHHGIHHVAHFVQFIPDTLAVDGAVGAILIFIEKNAGVSPFRRNGQGTCLQVTDQGRVLVHGAFAVSAVENMQAVNVITLKALDKIIAEGVDQYFLEHGKETADVGQVRIENQDQQNRAEDEQKAENFLMVDTDISGGIINQNNPGQDAVVNISQRNFLVEQILGF